MIWLLSLVQLIGMAILAWLSMVVRSLARTVLTMTETEGKLVTRITAVEKDLFQFANIAGSHSGDHAVRLEQLEDLVQELAQRVKRLEPWGDQAEDDDSTGDDLSDVPIMVVPAMMYPCPNGHPMLSLGYPEGETCPDCGALFTSFPPESPEAVALDKRTGGHSLPVLTSSYSVVCPACETVNKSEGVPPVRCGGCQAELPERQWPF